jgi:hypothetical protein
VVIQITLRKFFYIASDLEKHNQSTIHVHLTIGVHSSLLWQFATLSPSQCWLHKNMFTHLSSGIRHQIFNNSAMFTFLCPISVTDFSSTSTETIIKMDIMCAQQWCHTLTNGLVHSLTISKHVNTTAHIFQSLNKSYTMYCLDSTIANRITQLKTYLLSLKVEQYKKTNTQ